MQVLSVQWNTFKMQVINVMKKYMFFSVLISSLLMLFFSLLFAGTPAEAVYRQHTWWGIFHHAEWGVASALSHALLASFISWLYIRRETTWADGLRIGAIMGLVASWIFGLQLMLNVSELPLEFLSKQFLMASWLLCAFYVVSGLFYAMLFQRFAHAVSHQFAINNKYPDRLGMSESGEATQSVRIDGAERTARAGYTLHQKECA